MIRTDWVSPDVCFADFETQSLADLRKVGGRAYAAHPTTRPTLLALRRGDRRALWVREGLPIQAMVVKGYVVLHELPNWCLNAPVLCGHNSFEFDAHVWAAQGWLDMAWRDTSLLCRAAALAGGLDKAGEQLLGRCKDPRGHALKNLLCRARVGRDGQTIYPIGTPEAWLAFAEYCCQDCDLMADLYEQVSRFMEPVALTVHQEVNDRGVPVDVRLAGRLVLLQDELDLRAGRRVAELTEDDLEMGDVKSTLKVRKWLAGRGVNVSSLDKRALRDLLEDPDEFGDDVAAEVLRLRQQVVRATAGKAVRMIEAAGWERGRAYGLHVFYGAHTGRFSARSLQPHNFIRGMEEIDVHALARDDVTLAEVDAEAERATAERTAKGLGPCTTSDVIAALLRLCIAGRLAIGDYGAVEARMVAWLAGESRDLAAFADPSRDLYKELAVEIFGVPYGQVSKAQRFVAKTAILGCLLEGSPVATSRGWVPIEAVTSNDLVWDGVEWVKCDGAIYQGIQECVEVDGVWMTDEHDVLTTGGWREAWELIESTRDLKSGPLSVSGLSSLGVTLLTDASVDALAAQRNGSICTHYYQENLLAARLAMEIASHNEPSNISSLSRGMQTQGSRSIGSRMMGTTNLATSGLQHPLNRGTIEGRMRGRTYDVLNAGSRHRFQVGKLIVSNCGYGMSGRKFAVTLNGYGVESEVPPDQVVATYRRAHPRVVAGWGELDRAAKEALRSGGADACHVRFRAQGGCLLMFLPSGRPIVYRNAREEMRVPAYCAILGLPPEPRPTVIYRHPRGYDADMYGGRWMENASQGACRDLLVDAMSRTPGVCMHVHDEEVSEEIGAHELACIMSMPPAWAEGFPCLVEAFDSPRYAKKPPKGGTVYRALNGRLLQS